MRKRSMRGALIISIGWMIVARPVLAQEDEGYPPHPAYAAIEAELRSFFDAECPEAQLQLEEGVLIGRYQTQEFMVHNIDKTGHIAEEAHAEEGPNYQGFLLRLTIAEGPYEGAAVLPQVLTEPYWQTYINAFPLESGKYHIFISLSFGMRTEAHIIETLERVVFNFCKKNQ